MTTPEREVLDAALLLRLIERLHAEIWRRYADRLDPALDLIDAWNDARAVLDPESTERQLRPEQPLHPF